MTNGRIGVELKGPNDEIFRIETRLGNGAFGEVYKATGVVSATVIAIKMVPQNKLNDPTTLSFKTMLNEGRLDMMKVNHPNVVRVLHVDTGSNPNIGPFVMMECINGGTLHSLIEHRRNTSTLFPLDEALSLMRAIALGTQAINEYLVHRDIKPDNILLDNQGTSLQPRIADFGIAKVAAESTRPETFKGIQMVCYKAPEVWRQERNTIKIDVYSVGLVFYEILTLHHPLSSQLPTNDPFNWDKWREVHLSVPCPDVRTTRFDVPTSLAKLLLQMTDKSPGNRPNWEQVLQGLSIQVQASSKPPVAIDPEVLAAFKQQANERLREDQIKTSAELIRQRELERTAARREECRQSGKRLLNRFDEIIETLNAQETSYQIHITGEGTTSRTYTLPNGRQLCCKIFDCPQRPIPVQSNHILAGGYLGIIGGLSANLVLMGQPDNAASATWSAVEVTVLATIIGREEMKWYKMAELSNETIEFMKYVHGNEPWRRDAGSFFGFERAELFYQHYQFLNATHVYSFRTEPNVIQVFNQILKLGLRMPKK